MMTIMIIMLTVIIMAAMMMMMMMMMMIMNGKRLINKAWSVSTVYSAFLRVYEEFTLQLFGGGRTRHSTDPSQFKDSAPRDLFLLLRNTRLPNM